MIPMVNLKSQYNNLKEDITREVNFVLESTQFINGPNVKRLEQRIKDLFNVKYVLSCASGTDALQISMDALNIGPGDEVITTPFTFISTAWAISYCGARPIFVDIDPKTFNIDLNQVQEAITQKTKAVIPVHLFGQPVDMHALKDICKNREIKIIEDCAQSFGARILGNYTGTFGDFGCYSFFPSKNLGAYGDGGLIVTNDDVLAKKVSMLRNHGSQKRYHHDIVGYNSRLDEIQAAILNVKLEHFDLFNQKRKKVAQKYTTFLSDCDIEIPFEDGIGEHVYHQYTILCKERELLKIHLEKNGVSSAIYYPIPLHKQKVYSTDHGHLSLYVSESVAINCLSLPICPETKNDDIIKICELVKYFLQK